MSKSCNSWKFFQHQWVWCFDTSQYDLLNKKYDKFLILFWFIYGFYTQNYYYVVFSMLSIFFIFRLWQLCSDRRLLLLSLLYLYNYSLLFLCSFPIRWYERMCATLLLLFFRMGARWLTLFIYSTTNNNKLPQKKWYAQKKRYSHIVLFCTRVKFKWVSWAKRWRERDMSSSSRSITSWKWWWLSSY